MIDDAKATIELWALNVVLPFGVIDDILAVTNPCFQGAQLWKGVFKQVKRGEIVINFLPQVDA